MKTGRTKQYYIDGCTTEPDPKRIFCSVKTWIVPTWMRQSCLGVGPTCDPGVGRARAETLGCLSPTHT